jgi:hypothetical protein
MQVPVRIVASITSLGLVWTLVLIVPEPRVSPAAGSAASDGFSLVAPPAAIDAAIATNLKIVRDWLNDRDYISAAETAEGVVMLVHVYQYASDRPSWREKTAELLTISQELRAAAKAKDMPACEMALQGIGPRLVDLRQSPPGGNKATDKNFKPIGSTKALMKLMDGTYADAKAAKTADELEQLAYAIAEGANMAKHLRADSRWQQAAVDTRQTALEVAEKARADLQAARLQLKNVYTRCEACHQGFKR